VSFTAVNTSTLSVTTGIGGGCLQLEPAHLREPHQRFRDRRSPRTVPVDDTTDIDGDATTDKPINVA
jgi:hypothetical protein